jgi:hypothetical protein
LWKWSLLLLLSNNEDTLSNTNFRSGSYFAQDFVPLLLYFGTTEITSFYKNGVIIGFLWRVPKSLQHISLSPELELKKIDRISIFSKYVLWKAPSNSATLISSHLLLFCFPRNSNELTLWSHYFLKLFYIFSLFWSTKNDRIFNFFFKSVSLETEYTNLYCNIT